MEKRIQQRFTLNLPARLTARFTDSNGEETITTAAENISASGAFLHSTRPLSMAGRVLVEFQLAVGDLQKLRFILSLQSLRQIQGDQVWVKASGIVIRQDQHGAAVIFDRNYQLTPLPPASPPPPAD